MKHLLSCRTAATAALAVLGLGCSGKIESASFMRAEPLAPDSPVRVYSTQRPECAFDEVGLVTWRASSAFDNLDKALDRMRKRAREMGGHAIIGFGVTRQAAGATTTVSTDSAATTVRSTPAIQLGAEGIVIRFRDGACVDARSD